MKLETPLAGVMVCLLGLAAARQTAAAARTSQALHQGCSFRQLGRAESYPATVPGVVHLDLLHSKLIGDPFYRDYEQGLQWIGRTDWEYRSVFDAAPEILGRRHVDLVFDGLDTYAKVTLNGREILSADNMYRRWRVPVRRLLRPRGNELTLSKPRITTEVTGTDGLLRVRLSSDTLARHVRLGFDADGGFFEDNYFDLLPGVPVEITYKPKGAVSAEALAQGLTVFSPVDAF